MPGCGCSGGGGGGGACLFSNSGVVKFSGSCAAGISATVAMADIFNATATGTIDTCAPFELIAKQGATVSRVTIPRLKCAHIA